MAVLPVLRRFPTWIDARVELSSGSKMSIPLFVGAVSKLFLQAGCNEVRVDGLQPFVDRVKSGRGILTSEREDFAEF